MPAKLGNPVCNATFVQQVSSTVPTRNATVSIDPGCTQAAAVSLLPHAADNKKRDFLL